MSLSEEHEFAKLKVTELPHRAVDIDLEWVGLPIADGSLYLVVGAAHSASPCSEYELAALDMFILFSITVCGHSYRLSQLEGFTYFRYHFKYQAVWAGQAIWRVKRRVSNLDQSLS